MSSFARHNLFRTVPPILSAGAIALLCLAWLGVVRDPVGDEGTLAHLYQLAMILQIPLIGVFAVSLMRDRSRNDALILALQLSLWLAAIGLVPLLGF